MNSLNRSTNKKAQVVVFMIVGIVLIGVILGMIFLSQYIAASGERSNFPEIKAYVSELHDQALVCTMFSLGQTGGHLDPKTGLASIEQSNNAASLYMPTLIKPDWNVFESKGYMIEPIAITSLVEAGQKDVSAKVSNQFKASKNEKTIEFKDFASKVNVRYAYLQDIADIQNNDEAVNLNELAGLDIDKNIYFVKNSTVYVFTDKTSSLNNNAFEFVMWK